MNAKKKTKKRKLRVDRLAIVIIAMCISVGLCVTVITYIGNAIGNLLFASQEEISEHTQKDEKQTSSYTKESMIVLDAGHGGFDGGCEYGNYNEKTITLDVTLQIGKLLEEAGYQVVYTRTKDVALGNDEFTDLTNRVAFGASYGGDVFVSIHLNITENIQERVYGFEIYANEAMPKSMELAKQVDHELSALQYSVSRGILSGTHLHMVAENSLPAILIELGFLDDDEDRAYFTSAAGQKNIAQAIANAIIKEYS